MNIDKNIQEIPIEDIIPNRFQPRLSFNEEGINELSESIKQHGIIQPLVVRKLGDKFEIIAGERRYKAATQAGLTKVPVIISDIDDNKSAEVALVENIQRRNLTAIEEAKSYKNLLDRGYMTQEQLATKMGVSQSSIANKLRLLNLDEEVQDALLNEKISERHARALLIIEDKEEQKKWLKRILEERMTVRQLDMELKKLQDNDSEDDAGVPLVNINPNIDEIVSNAEDINVVREPHDIASMLFPNGIDPNKQKEEEKKETTPNDKIPNKFFNFLEDEEANMSVIEPDDILNTFTAETAPIATPVQQMEEPQIAPPNSIEILDDFDLSAPSIEPTNTLTDTSTIEISSPEVNEINLTDNITPVEPEEEVSNLKSIFFNTEEDLNPKTEPVTEVNNTIEEVLPTKEEILIDPMDSVIKLEPDYEEKQEELAGKDLKTAINVVRSTVEDLNRRGFTVEVEEADLEDIYHMTIKINK